jgi:hypothetical protein
MKTENRLFKPLSAFALTLALGAATLPGQAGAATAFDGVWSVQIKAENGDCNASYTVPIQVSDGRISYSGPFNAKASGKIGANGALSVSFAHSDKVVNARGSLKGGSGYGSWKSPSQRCDGTWVARKS